MAPIGRQDWKVHPHLTSVMRAAAADAKLPVYFVMRDRLGYHDWFPRVRRLDVEARRTLVVRELQAHAARTQAAVLAALAKQRSLGRVGDIRSNWLGNFVQARATRDAIGAAIELDEVWEVRYDGTDTADAIEDVRAGPTIPGSGPQSSRADLVWALGFRGQGVVVMNADSGINVIHRALENRLWTNPGEIAGNGLDDDGNGLVDDVHGWDFGFNTADLDDNGGHGTATAGVLVADDSCNNITYGIAPEGRVMTGKLLGETSQWAALQYALEMGAHTQTSSHSYKNDFVPPPNYAMHRDIGEATLAAGLIRTNSTSNNGGLCASGSVPEVGRPFNVSVPGNLPPPWFDPNQTVRGRPGGVIGVGAYRLSGGTLNPSSPCGPSAWNHDELVAVLPTYPLAWWDPLDDDYPWLLGAFGGLLKPDITAATGTQTTVSAGPVCSARPFGGTSNSTPIVNGCMMLWKGANMSLTPEDIAMVLHLSARDAGAVPGKENDWGAGRVDALAGLRLALAVHRVNRQPAWDVVHQSGTPITFEIDGSPDQPALIALGLQRQDVPMGPVTSGIGATVFQVFAGRTDAAGHVVVTLPVPSTASNVLVYSQAFIDDRNGPTGVILASNVIETEIVRR